MCAVKSLAAKLCHREHPHLDFEPRFYKRGTPQRAAIGCEQYKDYIRRATELLGV